MNLPTPEYPGYQLVPMNDVTDEARKIAVAWCDGFEPDLGMQIYQRHKLASDIMNYSKADNRQLLQEIADLKLRLSEKDEVIKDLKAAMIRGTDLWSKLHFDNEELPPIVKLEKMNIKRITKRQYLHHSTGMIPQINLQVPLDIFYDLLKNWGGMVSDSFHLKQKDVTDVQKYLLNWLTDQYDSKLLGSMTIQVWTQKLGNPEVKIIRIDEIKSFEKGWKLIQHY